MAGLLAAYPHPESDATLASRAQGMVDPLIAALTDSINRRATAGAGAIRGYTGQLQKDLAGYADSAKNIYGGAQASQAASDNALAQRLTGGGSELAAGLAARLKGIGNGSDPAVAAAAQDVAQTGQGSGNALYGKGSAALADLIARGAGAQDYAAKLPGIAGLGGAQQLGELEQRAQGDIAQGASDIRSKLPDLVASLRAMNDNKATNLAGARTDLFKYQQGRQDAATNRAADARTRTVLAKMANEKSSAKAQQDWNKFIASENDRASRQQTAIDAANSRAANAEAGRTARANAANAAKVAAAKAKAANRGGLTAGESATIQTKAAADADTFYYGVQPKQHYDSASGKWIANPSTGTPGLDYGQAVKRLMSKYPSLGQQGAQALLNNYYAPGERGRPAAPPPAPSPDTGFRGVTIP